MYTHTDKKEQRIARRVLRNIIHAGYGVRVHNGEDYYGLQTREQPAWDQMGETGMDRLHVFRLPTTANGDTEPRRLGSILLIYGNGEDLVSDASWVVEYEGSEAIIETLCYDTVEDCR